MSCPHWLRLGLVLGYAALLGCAPPYDGVALLENKPNDPLLASNVVAKVLIFVSNDCPIANGYSPTIRRLHEHYAPRGFAFWLVHCDPDETEVTIREHNREYGLNLPTLRDTNYRLARLGKAKAVPTASVFTSNGHLVYHGRIDDRFAALGVERPQALHHDLEAVLEAILSHRPVAVPETQAVGCYLPDSR